MPLFFKQIIVGMKLVLQYLCIDVAYELVVVHLMKDQSIRIKDVSLVNPSAEKKNSQMKKVLV